MLLGYSPPTESIITIPAEGLRPATPPTANGPSSLTDRSSIAGHAWDIPVQLRPPVPKASSPRDRCENSVKLPGVVPAAESSESATVSLRKLLTHLCARGPHSFLQQTTPSTTPPSPGPLPYRRIGRSPRPRGVTCNHRRSGRAHPESPYR